MCSLTRFYTLGYNSTALCDFYNMHNETIEHLFWECQTSQIIWNDLNKYLKSKHIYTKFNLYKVCFGIQEQIHEKNVLNFIIIICKNYILKMKVDIYISKYL